MADEASWQNHVDSVQRGSITANVQARRHGKEGHYEPSPFPRESEHANDPDDAPGGGSTGAEDDDVPDFSDPDFTAHFEDRHLPDQ